MSRKKVFKLDDKQWLKKQRQKYSQTAIAERLSKELGFKVYIGSVRWAERVFNAQEKATFVYERQHALKCDSIS